MGSNPGEVSLDDYIPQTITEFRRQVSMLGGNVSDKMKKIQDYVNRLEDEMIKIQAFKRELPLCLLLLNDVIVALKAECMQYKKLIVEPVLEEFMPMKKGSRENDKLEGNKDKDSREKMNWMSSVQLWNSDPHNPKSDIVNIKQSSKLEQSKSSPQGGYDAVPNDPFQSSKARYVGKIFPSFKGYSGFPVKVVRMEDKVGSQSNIQTVSQLQQQQAARKQRRCWSLELHRRFIDALQQLGGSQAATPKQIRELMQVDGLTNDEVKSHLQKYRLHMRKLPNIPTNDSASLGNLWMPQDQYGESSRHSSSQSGSPQCPLQLGGSSRGTSMIAGDSMEEEDDEKFESHSWKVQNSRNINV